MRVKYRHDNLNLEDRKTFETAPQTETGPAQEAFETDPTEEAFKTDPAEEAFETGQAEEAFKTDKRAT